MRAESSYDNASFDAFQNSDRRLSLFLARPKAAIKVAFRSAKVAHFRGAKGDTKMSASCAYDSMKDSNCERKSVQFTAHRIRRRPPCFRELALAVTLLLPNISTAADSDESVVAGIDELIRQGWADNEVTSSERATDNEFARRAALDIVGHIPPYDVLTEFLEDDSSDKRRKYVDLLLDEPGYVRNWTTKWANLLVGRANRNNRGARPVLERWLRDALNRNVSYDKFAFDLISAEGSSDQNGAVAFLSTHLNDGAVPATSITSRIFLGLQVQCTQCHNHPFNDSKQARFWGMNAFFRGTRRSGNGGQIQLTDSPSSEKIFFEKRSALQKATFRSFVDGTVVRSEDGEKPRLELAKLVTAPDQPYLAKTQVNRVWGHFCGFGFTKPIDDMGPHNPASHPELIDYLAKEFQSSRYDSKRLIRWITATEAYNLTSRYGEGNQADNPGAGNSPLFSKMYLKQFSAEQLYDSLLIATEADKSNRNEEQATNQRRAWLRQFVQTFGTDENDESTTFNGTIPQALVMMNGQLMGNALNGGQGAFLRRLLESPTGKLASSKKSKKKRRPRRNSSRPTNRAASSLRKSIPQKIETLFLVTLSRKPTSSEMNNFNNAYQSRGNRDAIQGMQDVFWALLNSNEFITNH